MTSRETDNMWRDKHIEVLYSEIKHKRIIKKDSGEVAGYIAYKMARDYSHVIASVSIRHPQDKNDPLLGKQLAELRMMSGEYLTLTPKQIASCGNISSALSGLRTDDLLEQTKLRYVHPYALMGFIYKMFGIPTTLYR